MTTGERPGAVIRTVGLPSGVTCDDLRVLGAHPRAGKHALKQETQDRIGAWLGLVGHVMLYR